MINVNQIGYLPESQKKAVITQKSDFFELKNLNGDVVYKAFLKYKNFDKSSGDEIYIADFSDFQKEGTYYLTAGDEKSVNFEIKKNIYKNVKNAMIKMLYLQRCGCELPEKYAGPYKHDQCHTDYAALWRTQDFNLDVTGGWHDAGDYGRYVLPAATTLGHLFYAYELFPDAFNERINIPESNDKIPDLLTECIYELKWMLKMQNQNGAVHNKVTTASFPAMIMPEKDKDKLYVVQIDSSSTASFSAIMAAASRIYKSYDKDFSKQMLQASKKAWQWLMENPKNIRYNNPEGVITGVYGDNNDKDERFWAAVELWRATGENEFNNYIEQNYKKDYNTTSLGWSDNGGFASLSYILNKDFTKNNEIVIDMQSEFIEKANNLMNTALSDGYNVTLGYNDYNWGSNMGLMNNAITLILAYIFTKNEQYHQIAAEQLNYLLGKNAMSVSYVTGFGERAYNYPHHRPSHDDGIEAAVPGMVSGGPNSRKQDEYMKKHVTENTPPAKCFMDNVNSYSSNEITIYWNSPAIFVAAFFDSFQ